MEAKKEAFKKFVIEQLKDFDYWREASPEGYAETIVDEAVKLFCQPDVVGRSELLKAFVKWQIQGNTPYAGMLIDEHIKAYFKSL
jgi:hypothetical protein